MGPKKKKWPCQNAPNILPLDSSAVQTMHTTHASFFSSFLQYSCNSNDSATQRVYDDKRYACWISCITHNSGQRVHLLAINLLLTRVCSYKTTLKGVAKWPILASIVTIYEYGQTRPMATTFYEIRCGDNLGIRIFAFQ